MSYRPIGEAVDEAFGVITMLRAEGAIAIQTLRGGDSAGEHTVLFVGQGERLELTHRALNRDHFTRARFA